MDDELDLERLTTDELAEVVAAVAVLSFGHAEVRAQRWVGGGGQRHIEVSGGSHGQEFVVVDLASDDTTPGADELFAQWPCVVVCADETAGPRARELLSAGADLWQRSDVAVRATEHPDLVRLLRAWVGHGDVLSLLLGSLAAAARRHVVEALLADQNSRLESRAAAQTRRVGLAQVFVDLPTHHSKRAFVAETLGGRRRFSARFGNLGLPSRRVVLLGGPGQGKTTLGQYLCQRHRAAWLAPIRDSLEPEVGAVLGAIERGAAGDGLPATFVRRFPFRVTLYRFAEKLADGAVADLWEALAAELQVGDAGAAPGTEAVRHILKTMPSLVVLDGLDEVPPTANRTEVLRLVEAFVQSAEGEALDLQLVATSRPQGYQQAFAADRWSHVSLADLGPQRATTYAQRLIAERHPADKDRRAEIGKRFAAALGEAETAALTRSPLQVTILVTLLEQRHRAPRDRWRLFREYYRVIFDRERERGIQSVEALAEHEEVINALHWEIGYRLHAREERSSGTTARIDEFALRGIVLRLLEADGHPVAARQALAERILVACRDRLVFLVAVEAGRVGFELRSLQEFAAGEYLLAAGDEVAIERVRRIAFSTHWRNVVKFAVGHVVADRPHLVPPVLALLAEDDAVSGSAANLARPGALLALDLAVADIGAQRPRVGDLLRELAMTLLGAIDDAWDFDSLGTLVRLEPVAARMFVERHAHAPSVLTWKLALWLANAGVEWARTWTEVRWHAAPFERLDEPDDLPWAQGLLYTRPFACPPSAWRRMWLWHFVHGDSSAPVNDAMASIGAALLDQGPSNEMYSISHGTVVWTFGRRLSAEAVRPPSDAHWGWWPLTVGANFAAQPSSATLAVALREIAKRNDAAAVRELAQALPWPLGCTAASATNANGWLRLADAAERGEMGGLEDWQLVEQRLALSTMSSADLDAGQIVPLPLTPEMARIGIPQPIAVNAEADLSRDQRHTLIQALLAKNATGLALKFLEPVVFWSDEGQTDDGSMAAGIFNVVTDEQVDALLDSPGAGEHGEVFFRSARRDDFAAWCPRLDRLGRRERITLWENIAAVVVDERRTTFFNPQYPGLVAWGAALHRSGNCDLDDQSRPSLPPAFFTDPRLAADALLLWLLTDTLTPEELTDLGRFAAERCLEVPTFLDDLDRFMRPHAEPFLVALAAHATDDGRARRVAGRHLAVLIEQRPTLLDVPEVAERLQLPDLAEFDHAAAMNVDLSANSAPAPLLAHDAVVQLSGAGLSDFRGFESLDITFSVPESGRGQWIFFAGDNGLGKSTILRGIVLALLQRSDAQTFAGEAQTPFVRFGASRALSSAVVVGPGRFDFSVTGTRVAPNDRAFDGFLVAYGSRRGTALGGPTQKVDFAPLDAVRSLFDETASLIHAESWLQKWDHRAASNGDGGATRRFVDALLVAVAKLIGVDRIEVTPDAVTVQSKAFGPTPIPLAAMSDGYLTVTGWVLDMVARWVERERNAGRAVTESFAAEMTGLVVVDEIDLHLHPQWQHTLVNSLRGMFPRMSFVVTTHNPVTLVAARPGEVFVLGRGTGGEVVVEQRDIPPGTDADAVLTGDWFGLASTMDAPTLDLLERHRLALRADPDSAESADLGRQVTERLGRPVSTDLANLAFRALAEVVDEDLRSMTHAEREAANDRLKAEIRRRLAERKSAP
jgi:hypothetical protein